MEKIQAYISVIFILTTLLTVCIFYKATNNSKITLAILLTWLAFQALIGYRGFYTITNTIPPRFLLLVLPAILFIIGLFTTLKGRKFLDSLDLKTLTILHAVRVPVEMVLFWLYINKAVPELMTFEGRNFDILSGITAPIIFYFGFIHQKLNRKLIIIWNFICIGLLLNIVTIAILSAQFSFQQFAFKQPNIAVLYFPFNWLPSCVVPLVLLSHLASIRLLLKTNNV